MWLGIHSGMYRPLLRLRRLHGDTYIVVNEDTDIVVYEDTDIVVYEDTDKVVHEDTYSSMQQGAVHTTYHYTHYCYTPHTHTHTNTHTQPLWPADFVEVCYTYHCIYY